MWGSVTYGVPKKNETKKLFAISDFSRKRGLSYGGVAGSGLGFSRYDGTGVIWEDEARVREGSPCSSSEQKPAPSSWRSTPWPRRSPSPS